MKASDLKASILQLAVSGKLVFQDPNDEPVSVLLKRIKDEREQFIKEGKIKKGKPLAEISQDEIPLEVPASWKWMRLGSIIELNPRNKLDDDLDVSFIPMTLIDDGYSNHHSSESRKWKEVKSGFTHFREGDLCLAKITPCFQNKKSAIFANLINGYGAGTTELHILRSFSSGINLQYVLWYVKCPFFIYKGMETFTGTAGQERVSADVVANQPLPLPPLAEQHRIVERIEELMPLIEAYDREEQKLSALEAKFPDALRQSILQYAVEGKLVSQKADEGTAAELLVKIRKERDALVKEGKIKKGTPLPPVSEEEKPFEIPESWEWVRLDNIVTFINGRAYKQTELLFSGKTPVLRVGNLFTNNQWYYSNLELEPEKYCEKGDLLFAWSASFGPFIWDGPKAIFHYHIWKIMLPKNINKNYLYYFLLSDAQKIKDDGHGLAMIHMTKAGIEQRLFPLPPLAEQQRIVERVEELMGLCDRL